MSQFKRILLTLDGSQLAERALQPAVTLAKATEAELIIVRVVTPIYFWAPFVEIEPSLEVAKARNEQETFDYLKEIRNRLLTTDSELNVSVEVLTGPVAEAIIDFAASNNVDLIVMSSHGRSGIGRWVYGSIAEKVLRGAKCCSTLIVRGDQLTQTASSEKEASEESIAID
ncbi:MAG TPA: universal stress protein [Candidatus Sulfomarinibacteraceae bacterium]|nr:universal stress protein [Candidatus Sulfomarinibacteraceae bacterium]